MFRYLEDILLLILFFYIARKALGLFFGYLFRSAGGQNHPGSGNSYQNNSNRSQSKPEGKIEINFMPPPKVKKVNDSEGEFVDYEEVKKVK